MNHIFDFIYKEEQSYIKVLSWTEDLIVAIMTKNRK
jgi:hypothetical protein